MPLHELVPHLKELSHSDKLLLLKLLIDELVAEPGLAPSPPSVNLSSQGLHDSFEAAAVLAKALAEEQVVGHGWLTRYRFYR